jgi:hypothetical protein
MPLSTHKLKRLETIFQKKAKRQSEGLIIPDNWVEFARLTSIRSGGTIKRFDPYDYQKELVDLMLERSVVIVKSRQLGISETITCFMLWRACLNPGYLGLVFSKTQTDSSLLARRMKRMIESLGLKTATENLSDIEIEGRGRILFRNSKPESGRGIESVVDVLYDEWAFVDTAKEVHDAVAPSQQMVGTSAREFIVSTPNGKAGFYWDLLNSGNDDYDVEMLCDRASKGLSKPFQYWVDKGGWGKVLIHWKAHPVYGGNPNFLQDIHEKQKLSWATIHQEYNLSFQESDTNYFTADIVKKCISNELVNIDEGFYFIGIDTATTGDDYCVCVVLKLDFKGVFTIQHLYRKKQQSSEYHIFQFSKIIEQYKPVSIAVEVTGGTGQVYLEQLSRNNFYKFQAIRTTGDSKPAMLDRLKLMMESNKFFYSSNSPIIDELLNFKRNDKKLEAASGKHDDVIMACCFALAIAEKEQYVT